MSSRPAPDFARIAARYDELRPVDDNWWEVYRLVERLADLRGRRVLDAGCGTGRLSVALAERAGAKVWGVDRSPEMLAEAKAKAPPRTAFRVADLHALPFKDGWFERVVLWLVVHLLDADAALREARRVLETGGRAAVVTFDHSHFDAYWLNAYLPSLQEVDRARFPSREELERAFRAAGFRQVELVRHDQTATLPRESALERIRGRHISTFQLIGDDEYQVGLRAAERDLPDPVEYELRWLVAVGEAA
jgi:SAM-dependent methyltransferase